MAHESRLLPIFRRDGSLLVAGVAIQRREDGRLAEAVDALVHPGQRVRILLGDDVQQSIIDAEAEVSSLLGDEQDPEAPLRRRPFDDVRLQLPLDLGRLGLPRRVPRAARREADRPGAGVEVDALLGGFDDAERLARPHCLVLVQHAADPGVQRRVDVR